MGIKELSQAANEGLIKSYCASNTGQIRLATVREVQVFTAHFDDYSKDATYTDQWIKSDQLTGGQEIIKVNNEILTRLYAGGTINIKKIEELGITQKDVYKYLKKTIKENPQTRLFEACFSEYKDGWDYYYKILNKDKTIPYLTMAKERIRYKHNNVFVQNIIICPVK